MTAYFFKKLTIFQEFTTTLITTTVLETDYTTVSTTEDTRRPHIHVNLTTEAIPSTTYAETVSTVTFPTIWTTTEAEIPTTVSTVPPPGPSRPVSLYNKLLTSILLSLISALLFVPFLLNFPSPFHLFYICHLDTNMYVCIHT